MNEVMACLLILAAIAMVCVTVLLFQREEHKHDVRPLSGPAPVLTHLEEQIKELKSAVSILNIKDGFKK